MKIACVDKEVRQILQGGFYKIPGFQRPYSWDRENIEDFWQDTTVTYVGDYFIGSMVVYKKSDYYYVVDGQQRLTTITILLAAIRDGFKRLNDNKLANGLQRMLERPDITNDDQYIVQPETSYPFFQEVIQKNSNPELKFKNVGEEEIALQEAYKFFMEKISTVIGSAGAERLAIKGLEKIRDGILGLKVIFVEVDNEDDAYIIFETMNTRGKDLEPADLIKNQLSRLLRSKNSTVNVIAEKWADIRNWVEGGQSDFGMDSFLYHHWLSRYEFVTQKEIFKSAKAKVNKSNAKVFLDSLHNDAEIYSWIIDPTIKKWTREEGGIKKSLMAISQFRFKQPLPMILAVLGEYKDRRLDLKSVKAILQSIEHFHVIFTAITAQRSSGGISFMYAHHARNLRMHEDVADRKRELQDLIRKLKEKLPSKIQFEEAFVGIKYSDLYSKQKKIVQYLLGKVQQHGTTGVSIDFGGMSIEHILSQSSGEEVELISSIGNLILVESAFNSNELANKPFVKKKGLLVESNVAVDSIIEKSDDWGVDQIKERASFLANISFDEILLV